MSEVTDIGWMFQGCTSLTSLDLTCLQYNSLSEPVTHTFWECTNLEYINLNNVHFILANDNEFISAKKNIVFCNQNNGIINKFSVIECKLNDCSENWRENQQKLIFENNVCVDNCLDTSNNKYNYNNICYNSCQVGTYNNNFKCEDCPPQCKTCDKQSFELNLCTQCNDNYYPIYDEVDRGNSYLNCSRTPAGYYLDINNYKPCYKSCRTCEIEGNYINHNCISCKNNYKFELRINRYSNCYIYNENENENEIFINTLENFDIILNNILHSYTSENFKGIKIIRPDDIVYHITDTKNELESLKNKSNSNNISIIDLDQCETLLRKENNINDEDPLIFIKNEIPLNKPSEKNVNFEVYEPYNKKKLNLSICDETLINIYFPMELSKETKQLYENIKDSGYDMFNINDPFYQDICTPYDSFNGTDILLIDRINYIYDNDDAKCQSNCQFSYYFMDSKYMQCNCSIKEGTINEVSKIDKFSSKKIYESFYDVLKYSNYDILKCYKIIFNISVIKSNIGSIIVILFFFCYLICLLTYLCKGIEPLKEKLRITFNKEKIKINFNSKSLIYNLLYPPFKKNSNYKLFFKAEKRKNKNIISHNRYDIGSKNSIYNNIQIYSNSNSKINALKNDNIFNRQKIKKQNTYNKNESKKIYKRIYSDYELNELEYKEALKLDKRTLFQIYFAALKREHLIIFTFCSFNDFNLISVKLTRFVFLIVGDMALNTFFFSDDSMHKLFLNYGKYDFIQQIPQITYSTIISSLIEIFLCYLSLTDKYFYLLKSSFIKGDKSKIIKPIKCIKKKLIFFFIFIFIFFIMYWYIISVFCGVYRNTQITFIKDSVISFSINLIYPLFLYFISASLRSCSLRNKKKNCKCLYNFSYIIPFF